jgi:Na+-translocating ferredoxin:NAD+ oxidoreductase RnfG subunit
MKMKFVFIQAALLVALLLLPTDAESKVFFTVKALLSEQFKASKRVGFVKVAPDKAERAALEKRLGRALPRGSYAFYVAQTGDRIDGYALFDSEIGQHEPIDFATFFDASGKVTRVEVVAYREAYGTDIRREQFRKQFVGRNGKSGFKPGSDIDIVSGATISSKSAARAVERAAVLLNSVVLKSNR